jgi:hypothetical protein
MVMESDVKKRVFSYRFEKNEKPLDIATRRETGQYSGVFIWNKKGGM